MKKIKYKDQTNKNLKKILIVLFVVVFILMIISNILKKSLKQENVTEVSYDNLSTIKEVIEYYKSTYISEETSTIQKFSLDVYLKFKVLPYENDESNEEYYNDLLGDSAKILRYTSFRMIDKENDITVQVICNGSKIQTIIINDIEDYFIYMDSQISLKKYKESPITDFKIESEILNKCVENDWKDINLGEKDSIFDKYYIYFTQGIRVRTINNRVYNIIFDKNYDKNVVNNIFPGTEFSYIRAVLGDPTFENENIIGYKGNEMYIFFTENEISVYRNSKLDIDDFLDLVDKYIKKELDLLDFMNEVTYLWPDYSEYTYTSSSVFLSYPLKGIEIKINYDDESGILVYNNIKSDLTKIGNYLENTNFVSKLQIDLVFETENKRILKEDSLLKKCLEYEDTLSDDQKEIIGESLNYGIYPELDLNGYIYSMKFISKFNTEPNRELNDFINSYLWANNDYFIYSKTGKGIYLYNLKDGKVRTLILDKDEFKLLQFENGILKYDDKELIVDL